MSWSTVRRGRTAVRLLGAALFLTSVAMACDLGPFPDFREPLDQLSASGAPARGWLHADGSGARLLILAEDNSYLTSEVSRDGSVLAEIGKYEPRGSQVEFSPRAGYSFPAETVPVNQRSGAQPRDDLPESRRLDVTVGDESLNVEGWGEFRTVEGLLGRLDLTRQQDRHCLLRFIQVSLRSSESRLRNFGSSGTVIYHDNESSFDGFLAGELSIVLRDLLSPKTTLRFDAFQDLPELVIDGEFTSRADTSGSGQIEGRLHFRFESQAEGPRGALGGQGGLASGRRTELVGVMVYGGEKPIILERGNIVGGSYGLFLEGEAEAREQVDHRVLLDLDLSECP